MYDSASIGRIYSSDSYVFVSGIECTVISIKALIPSVRAGIQRTATAISVANMVSYPREEVFSGYVQTVIFIRKKKYSADRW